MVFLWLNKAYLNTKWRSGGYEFIKLLGFKTVFPLFLYMLVQNMIHVRLLNSTVNSSRRILNN